MFSNNRKLAIEHLDKKFTLLSSINWEIPSKGWINTIRRALGISLEQIGSKLKISKQAVKQHEDAEINGSITFNSIQLAADALDMKLVYALIPKDGTLENLIEKRARKIAEEIVMRTSTTMMLEDQENSKERLEKAVREKTEELKRELPKYLWD